MTTSPSSDAARPPTGNAVLGTAKTPSSGNPDTIVLQLAVRKGFMPQEAARALHAAKLSSDDLDARLVADGHLTRTQVETLRKEAAGGGGQIVAGYRLLSKLGEGGMGQVFKAHQISMDRTVALKVLAPQYAKNPGFIERFQREARAAGKIVHPHVVTCFDVAQDGGRHVMALEYMPGGDAQQLARRSAGRLDWRRAAGIVRDCARGLQAIHAAGLVHRDIKPANIFLAEDGSAKLGDLGLARSTDGEDALTLTGSTLGTPAFMSPEQAEGRADLDIRTDTYALGATLYALISGTLPFQGTSALAIARNVVEAPVPDLRAVVPDVPQDLVGIVHTAMAKRREERYQEPQDLVLDLERVLRGEAALHAAQAGVYVPPYEIDSGKETSQPLASPVAAPARAEPGRGPRVMRQSPASTAPAAPSPARGGGRLIGIAVGACALLGVGAWYAFGGGSADASPPPVPSQQGANAGVAAIPESVRHPLPQDSAPPEPPMAARPSQAPEPALAAVAPTLPKDSRAVALQPTPAPAEAAPTAATATPVSPSPAANNDPRTLMLTRLRDMALPVSDRLAAMRFLEQTSPGDPELRTALLALTNDQQRDSIERMGAIQSLLYRANPEPAGIEPWLRGMIAETWRPTRERDQMVRLVQMQRGRAGFSSRPGMVAAFSLPTPTGPLADVPDAPIRHGVPQPPHVAVQTPPPAASPAVAKPAAPTAAPAATPPSAPPAPAAEPWLAAAKQASEAIAKGDYAGAAAIGKDLPAELAASLVALKAAPDRLHAVFAKHSATLVAAKPALPTLPAGSKVTAFESKGVAYRYAPAKTSGR